LNWSGWVVSGERRLVLSRGKYGLALGSELTDETGIKGETRQCKDKTIRVRQENSCQRIRVVDCLRCKSDASWTILPGGFACMGVFR
jgi:hypothetical protein